MVAIEGRGSDFKYISGTAKLLRQMSSRAFSRPVGVIHQPNPAFSRNGQSSIRIHEGDCPFLDIPRPSQTASRPLAPQAPPKSPFLARNAVSACIVPRQIGRARRSPRALSNCSASAPGGRVPRDDGEDSHRRAHGSLRRGAHTWSRSSRRDIFLGICRGCTARKVFGEGGNCDYAEGVTGEERIV